MGKVIRTYFDKTPLDFLEWNGSTTSGFVTVIKLERINASARVTTRFPFITISEGDFHYFDKFKLFIEIIGAEELLANKEIYDAVLAELGKKCGRIQSEIKKSSSTAMIYISFDLPPAKWKEAQNLHLKTVQVLLKY